MSDLSIYRGDDATITLTVKDSSGSVVDITGFTFWITVKVNASDSDENASIQKTVTNHTDPTNGETQIILDNNDTAINIGSYIYDIQMKDGNEKITTLTKGAFRILRDVTLS